jgi:hypothetical protein
MLRLVSTIDWRCFFFLEMKRFCMLLIWTKKDLLVVLWLEDQLKERPELSTILMYIHFQRIGMRDGHQQVWSWWHVLSRDRLSSLLVELTARIRDVTLLQTGLRHFISQFLYHSSFVCHIFIKTWHSVKESHLTQLRESSQKSCVFLLERFCGILSDSTRFVDLFRFSWPCDWKSVPSKKQTQFLLLKFVPFPSSKNLRLHCFGVQRSDFLTVLILHAL